MTTRSSEGAQDGAEPRRGRAPSHRGPGPREKSEELKLDSVPATRVASAEIKGDGAVVECCGNQEGDDPASLPAGKGGEGARCRGGSGCDFGGDDVADRGADGGYDGQGLCEDGGEGGGEDKEAGARAEEGTTSSDGVVLEMDGKDTPIESREACQLKRSESKLGSVMRSMSLKQQVQRTTVAIQAQRATGAPVHETEGRTPLEVCGLCCCALMMMMVLLCCIFAIPITHIVFSQVFPWSETGRKDESGEPLSCNSMFPNMMLISGCLQIAVVFEEVVAGLLLATADNKKIILAVRGCFRGCLGSALLMINIMMWLGLFQSDKECGPQLWDFGVYTVPMYLLHFGFSGDIRILKRCWKGDFESDRRR